MFFWSYWGSKGEYATIKANQDEDEYGDDAFSFQKELFFVNTYKNSKLVLYNKTNKKTFLEWWIFEFFKVSGGNLSIE